MEHVFSIRYQSFDFGKDLDIGKTKLLEQALSATNNAYAPYSKYYVGAALLLENEIILTGCNQENASYPCGICAERTVLFSKSALHPKEKILAIAVVVKNHSNATDLPPASCGLCRQVMLEFEFNNKQPIQVILGHPERTTLLFNTCADLLPLAFTPQNLK